MYLFKYVIKSTKYAENVKKSLFNLLILRLSFFFIDRKFKKSTDPLILVSLIELLLSVPEI